MKNKIKSFSENINGNDYIVGDIHGEFKELYNKLLKLNFDFNNDRLFSVGDLCDRGKDSKDIIDWLKYDWFYPVLGNHEDLLLNVTNGNIIEDILKRIGGSWWFDLNKEEKEILYLYYSNLPIGIELEIEQKTIGILHAACPYMDWLKFKNNLDTSKFNKVKHHAIWTYRKTLENPWAKVKNIDYLFVGHSKVESYVKYGNTFYMDTGSGYQNGKVTVIKIKDIL